MRGTPEQRFWAKVALPNENGCMLWTGATQPNGYGSFGLRKGKVVRAHRFSYALSNGEIPVGLEVDHLCSVRNCVAPLHLDAVTRQVNVRRSGHADALRRRGAARTHCRRGHEFTPNNTYQTGHGRSCRECQREHCRAYRQRKKEAA